MTKRKLYRKKLWIVIALFGLYISAPLGIVYSIKHIDLGYSLIIISSFFCTHAVLTTLLYFIDKELYGEKLTDKEETKENGSNKDDKKE